MQTVRQAAILDQGSSALATMPSTYPPSWADRLFDWVRRQPVPPWLFYVGLWLLLYLAFSLATWIEGSEPVGVLSLAPLDGAMYMVYYLAMMHYLDGVAGRALDYFRPLLTAGEEDCERLRYELTTLPARQTLLAGAIGALVTIASLPFTPSDAMLIQVIRRPSTQLAAVGGNLVLATFFYHTVRQLRIVNRIHASLAQVDLYQREPIYAFSRLTARTGLIWVLGISMGLIPHIGPLFTSQNYILLWAPLVPLAGLLFVLPLVSIHRLLVCEKRQLQAAVERRLATVFGRLHGQMDAGDLANVGGLKVLLDSLLVERDTLAKIPTWPWKSGTVAGFTSALLIPLVIWVFQQILMDLLSGR